MSKKVRVGIVGMGIGRPNAQAIEANERGEVAALCDLEVSRMDDFEKNLGHEVKKYTDFKEMCRDSELDAIFIGTPNQLHVPIGLEAIKNDKHVMITKPLADSLNAAKQVVKAAEAAGVVNMMSLSTRFGPGCRYLHKQKDAGIFGDIYYARARSVRRSGIPAWNLGFIHAGGGAFRDMGVHVLDASWALLGFPQPVSVTGVAGAKFGPRGQGYWELRAIYLKKSIRNTPPTITAAVLFALKTAPVCKSKVSGPAIKPMIFKLNFSAPKPAPNSARSPFTKP